MNGHTKSIILLVALLGSLLCVSRPWADEPFDTWDYSEFVPLLKDTSGFPDAYRVVARYHRDHGRSAHAGYAYLAASWILFGEDAAAWRYARVLLIAANLALLFAFLRSLGFRTEPAAAGAALMIFSSPAVVAWGRITFEPIALAGLLVGLLAASRYRRADRWPVLFVLILVCQTVVVLSKEILLVLVPFLWAFASCWDEEEGISLPRTFGTRHRSLWAAGGTLSIVLAGWFVIGSSGAATRAYASGYDLASIGFGSFVDHLGNFILPVHDGPPWLLFTTHYLFLVIVGVGLLRRVRLESRRRVAIEVAWCLLPTVTLAVAYAAWEQRQAFYALPVMPAAAVLLALGMAGVNTVRPGGRWASRGALVALALLATGHTVTATNHLRARREVDAGVAEYLARTEYRLALVSLPDDQLPERGKEDWTALPATLRRYASVLPGAGSMPPVRAIGCSQIPMVVQAPSRGVTVIRYGDLCGQPPVPIPPAKRIRADYFEIHWSSGSMRERSVVTEIWSPPGPS